MSRTGKPSEENKSKGKTDREQLKLNRRRKTERANRQSMMLRCSERRFVTDSRDEEHRGEGRTLRASLQFPVEIISLSRVHSLPL